MFYSLNAGINFRRLKGGYRAERVKLFYLHFFDQIRGDILYNITTISDLLEMHCIIECMTGHILKKITSLLICIHPV